MKKGVALNRQLAWATAHKAERVEVDLIILEALIDMFPIVYILFYT